MITRRSVKVKRYDPGQYQDGVWNDGSVNVIHISASVRPASPTDLESLPEGRRSSQTYTLYSRQQFQPVDDQSNQQADLVELEDGDYEVVSSMPFQGGLISHFKTMISKKTES